MAYLDDFIDNTLAFLGQNIVYIGVAKETNGLIDVVIEPRAVPSTISNIAAGLQGGIVAGGVYMLRPAALTDPRSLPVYFCGYEQNSVRALTIGNAAEWVFTPPMDGCTFGIGSQGPLSGGHVHVAHVNTSRVAAPGKVFTDEDGEARSGRRAQSHLQSMLARSHVGPGGVLIKPRSYMGHDFGAKATTFGHHLAGQPWSFHALSYRQAGSIFRHEGIIDYP